MNRNEYVVVFSGYGEYVFIVFCKNIQHYPESWNVYDSLGEAYMTTGQKALSIQNYEKSLQLNPKNDHEKEMLEKARAMK